MTDLKGKQMTEARLQSPTAPIETKPKRRIGPVIVRILLGLLFLLFGLNGFLNFIPTPKDLPPDIVNVSGALMKAGYMTVVAGTEVIVAVLLITGFFVPL